MQKCPPNFNTDVRLGSKELQNTVVNKTGNLQNHVGLIALWGLDVAHVELRVGNGHSFVCCSLHADVNTLKIVSTFIS